MVGACDIFRLNNAQKTTKLLGSIDLSRVAIVGAIAAAASLSIALSK